MDLLINRNQDVLDSGELLAASLRAGTYRQSVSPVSVKRWVRVIADRDMWIQIKEAAALPAGNADSMFLRAGREAFYEIPANHRLFITKATGNNAVDGTISAIRIFAPLHTVR